MLMGLSPCSNLSGVYKIGEYFPDQEITMFAMFKQFFFMFASLFSAGNHSANALNLLAISLEEAAASYADEQRFERQTKLAKLKASLKEVKATA